MTNAELIEKLKKLPLDLEIVIDDEAGLASIGVDPEVRRIDGEDVVVLG